MTTVRVIVVPFRVMSQKSVSFLLITYYLLGGGGINLCLGSFSKFLSSTSIIIIGETLPLRRMTATLNNNN